MVLFKVAPWKVSFYFAWFLTVLYFLVNRKVRDIIRNNIDEVFARSRSQNEIDLIFQATLRGIFHHYFEKLFLAYSNNGHWKEYFLENIRVSGKRLLDLRLSERKGLILATPHFGGLEFLPGFLTLLGYRVAIVAKFKTRRLREKCEKKARAAGATIIDADRKSSFSLALSALKEGRILITQCDEVECWKINAGESIPIFGTAFHMDRTLGILKKRSKAPLVFGYIKREGEGGYTVEIEDICGSGATTPEGLTETVLRKLEKLVYTYPDQWYIWKKFQLMKRSEQEEIAVEDRRGRDLLVTSPLVPTLQPSRSFAQSHREYCCQTPI